MMKELTCVLEDNETEMDIECGGGRGNRMEKVVFIFKKQYYCGEI